MSLEGTIIGYDPGGNDSHGLALIRYKDNLIIDIKVSTHSTAQSVLDEISMLDNVIAIGVDTLTCWSTGPSGWRPADRWLKKEYREITHSIASANSLFGSMGLNGMSVLLSLKAIFPKIKISETHPKVLYFEISKRKYDYKESRAEMDSFLSALLGNTVVTRNDHEWDAVISVLAVANGMTGKWANNLHSLPTEKNEKLVEPCGQTVYWWPK
jgi:hypothetical protein